MTRSVSFFKHLWFAFRQLVNTFSRCFDMDFYQRREESELLLHLCLIFVIFCHILLTTDGYFYGEKSLFRTGASFILDPVPAEMKRCFCVAVLVQRGISLEVEMCHYWKCQLSVQQELWAGDIVEDSESRLYHIITMPVYIPSKAMFMWSSLWSCC